MTGPAFNDLVKLTADGWNGVPESTNPFYFGSKQGLFLVRRGLLGRGAVKVKFWPENYKTFKTPIDFEFSADPIPARLMGQIVNFFERIYDRQHSEAAVLLIMHAETKEWRVFVPTQLVSHGGVNYVFDPIHVQYPWVLVGSIHSHCDFGAGHSGTDTGDAEGFDGFHCTIGMIKRPIPQIVAMMSMNKENLHYKAEDFPTLFDFSEPKEHEAPAWWDRYVENTITKAKPIGFDLFAKFKKSTTKITKITQITPVRQPNNGYGVSGFRNEDWVYSEAAGRMVHKSWTVAKDGTISYQSGAKHEPFVYPAKRIHPNDWSNNKPGVKPLGADADDWDDFYRLQGMDGPPLGYENYKPRAMIERGYSWDPEIRTWVWTGTHPEATNESREFNARQMAERGQARWGKEGELDNLTDEQIKNLTGNIWEDELEKEVTDIIFDSDLLTDGDIELAFMQPDQASTKEYWREVMVRKAVAAVTALNDLGLAATLGFNTPPKDIEIALLPERATKPEEMRGTH